jgi:hypothetical protein
MHSHAFEPEIYPVYQLVCASAVENHPFVFNETMNLRVAQRGLPLKEYKWPRQQQLDRQLR